MGFFMGESTPVPAACVNEIKRLDFGIHPSFEISVANYDCVPILLAISKSSKISRIEMGT